MEDHPFIPLDWTERSADEMLERAEANYADLAGRRTTRNFSDRDVDRRAVLLDRPLEQLALRAPGARARRVPQKIQVLTSEASEVKARRDGASAS